MPNSPLLPIATRLLLPAVSALLPLTHAAASFSASAQSLTPSQLRHMTAAQFQAGIDKEGAEAFTRRVTQEIDPHGKDEPNYDIILNHVSTGEPHWLRIAAEIGPYAGEPDFNTGLNVAIAYALLENPAAVLRMRGADEHFLNACMYPFPRPSRTLLRGFQRNALAALTKVHDPALKAAKDDCRRELETLPTEKASNGR